MEHRLFTRQAADINTVLYRRGLPIATGRLRDVSRGGAFVETDYPGLERYQRLQFECCVGTHRLRMSAHVRRREGAGIALEIDDDNAETSVDIATLLALNPQRRTPFRSFDSDESLECESGRRVAAGG